MKSSVLLFIIIYIHVVSNPIISIAYNIHNITIYHQLAFFMFWIISDQFQIVLKI
jgi:hypothetical protein